MLVWLILYMLYTIIIAFLLFNKQKGIHYIYYELIIVINILNNAILNLLSIHIYI